MYILHLHGWNLLVPLAVERDLRKLLKSFIYSIWKRTRRDARKLQKEKEILKCWIADGNIDASLFVVVSFYMMMTDASTWILFYLHADFLFIIDNVDDGLACANVSEASDQKWKMWWYYRVVCSNLYTKLVEISLL